MNGLHTTTSDFSVTETVNRMVSTIEEEGWHIFTRIDHAKEAREKGLELRPTVLILFGNPEIGTHLMRHKQIAALDLPMKVLVWEAENGQTMIACNNPEWLRKRYELTDVETLKAIDEVTTKVCDAAKND